MDKITAMKEGKPQRLAHHTVAARLESFRILFLHELQSKLIKVTTEVKFWGNSEAN